MTGESADRLRALVDRPVSIAELRAALDTPLSDAERAAVAELVAWFTRRYPTGAERLAYVRRAYRRWHRTRVVAHAGPSTASDLN
jgi:hypothetical protein